MKVSWLLKPSSIPTLITLILALLISACSENSGSSANSTNNTDTNQAAVISGKTTGSVTEDNDPDGNNLLEVSGTLNIIDNDAGEAAFVAKTYIGNYGNLMIDVSGNWTYAADNNQSIIQNLTSSDTLMEILTISSIDGTTQTVVITLIGIDEAGGSMANLTLSWVAPTAREDNTPMLLSEIAGYKIYYGTSQGSYNNSVDINDGTAEGYTLANLPTSTYYIVITTRDTAGRESRFSSEFVVVV